MSYNVKDRISSLKDRVQQIVDGSLTVVSLPWRQLNALTSALYPGTSTLLCGTPGSSKSLMMLQAALYWQLNGIKFALYELEEDKNYHLMRMLAQHVGNSGFTELKWIAENSQEVDRQIDQNSYILNTFSSQLWASAIQLPNLYDIGNWIEDRAKEGCRVIGVDPITKAALVNPRNRVSEEKAFVDRVGRIAVNYKASLFFVTHPKQEVNVRPDMASLAGSAEYSRFSQTIFWLQPHPEKSSRVQTELGPIDDLHNRTLHILKARNGKGAGCKLAWNFNIDSLTLNEQGLILRKEKS